MERKNWRSVSLLFNQILNEYKTTGDGGGDEEKEEEKEEEKREERNRWRWKRDRIKMKILGKDSKKGLRMLEVVRRKRGTVGSVCG